MNLGRKYYPQGMAGEFAMKQDIKRERKKRLDKAMCYESHGPGWTYNETIGKCMMPVAYGQDGTNIPDLVNEGMPPSALPEPENLPPSGPEGSGNAAIQAEINNRKDNATLEMQRMQGENIKKMRQMEMNQKMNELQQVQKMQRKMTAPPKGIA